MSPLFSYSIMADEAGDLRQRLRDRRRDLTLFERRQAAEAIACRLEDWPAVVAAHRIAAYWACEGELDPAPFLERAWAAGQQLYLPVLTGTPSLRFAPYWPTAPLRRNRFNIPEPDVLLSECLEPSELDLVLTPLVAFDGFGHRLGMGGGFYDRSFAFLIDPAYRGHRPYLLGLGYEFQKVTELFRHPWDVPLNAAATETASHVFSETQVTGKR